MITEIVLFHLPDGMSREDAIAKYRLSVPAWRANPDLIRKTFLFDETSRRGGAVYNWKSMEAAKLGQGPEFQKRDRARTGIRSRGSGPRYSQSRGDQPVTPQ
jgi:hypothetical protein